jgi:hypothetical protein
MTHNIRIAPDPLQRAWLASAGRWCGALGRNMRRIVLAVIVILIGHEPLWAQEPGREIGDYNFDGHLDYRQASKNPGNQCGWWEYFIFDESVGEYRFIETALCKEQFDPVAKLVKTRASGGMAGDVYVVRHLKWVGLRLIPTFAESQTYDAGRHLFIRTRVTNIDSTAGPTIASEILTPEQVAENRERPE